MTRYVAFLRAINVGGHVVKMDHLRQLFESLGFSSVETFIDDLHVRGREIYWLCRKKQSESTISNTLFSKTLGQPATVRGANTVKKMAAKYAGSKV